MCSVCHKDASIVGLVYCSPQSSSSLPPSPLQTRRSVLKGTGSASVALPPVDAGVHTEYSSDEDMDESLVRSVRQTVDQALLELGEPVTEVLVVEDEHVTSCGVSYHPKAHSTPSQGHVQQKPALLDYSDCEGDISILMRRPLYPLQQDEEEEEVDGVETDGGASLAPAAERQAPAWLNLNVCELFLLVLVGLIFTVLFWFALQQYKMG